MIFLMQSTLNELKEKESSLSSFPASELSILAGLNTAEKLPGMEIFKMNSSIVYFQNEFLHS